MDHIAKREQAIRDANALIMQNAGLNAFPQADGMIFLAVGIEVIHVERARAILEAAGFSSQQAAMFVTGVIGLIRDKLEHLVDDYHLRKQKLQ